MAAVSRFKGRRFPSLAGTADILLLAGTWSVLLFRIAHALQKTPFLKLPARLVYLFNITLTGADLNPGARIGPGLIIGHTVGTAWGGDLNIGANVVLTGDVRFGLAATPGRKGGPVVGDNCIFLDGSKVLGPAHIGDGAVIAANTLVLEDVPAGAVMVGQPARFLRWREDDGIDASE